MRKACLDQKKARQLKMTATVARVLNLQRKGLQALLQNHEAKKQERIYQTFCATLYYKNLCSKVLLSLKIYSLAKHQNKQLQKNIDQCQE